MQVKEAVILAGGLGTRLRSVISDLPKAMAPVNGKPFLHYLIQYLQINGVHRIILSVGYLHEKISAWCNGRYPGIEIAYALEETPLGTGGGIRLALQDTKHKDILVINGDTFFDFDIPAFTEFYSEKKSDCAIALKPLEKFSRYGCVTTDDKNQITGFLEKGYHERGYINAGVYLINKFSFLDETTEGNFSFEKDYLEKNVNSLKFYGKDFDGYFIDIGIPEDYERVQSDFLNLFPDHAD